MNGAHSLLATLTGNGIDVCFANPGTSEMHLVAALDQAAALRCVLGLFEGVVTGAADGYARMAGRPAATLLHLGPGLANGLSNLHNAMRAQSPVVNVIGDHATYHRRYDAPLTSDIEGTARPFSHWVRTTPDAGSIAADAAAAIAAARTAPGRVASLIVPADAAWTPLAAAPSPARAVAPAPPRGSCVPASRPPCCSGRGRPARRRWNWRARSPPPPGRACTPRRRTRGSPAARAGSRCSGSRTRSTRRPRFWPACMISSWSARSPRWRSSRTRASPAAWRRPGLASTN